MAELLGLRVDPLSRRSAEERLSYYLKAESDTSHLIVTANAEMYCRAARDAALKKAINSAALCLPDSIGILWGLRRSGCQSGELYPGVELAAWLLSQNLRVYVLGATVQTLARLNYPAIVGSHQGFFRESEEAEIIAEIRRLRPQVILAALGAGRQELWLYRRQKELPACILLGVGGAIDVLSGVKRRAPYFWRKHHLEWFYRLLREPWRCKRQLALLRFGLMILRRPKPSGKI